ncbi:alpha-N-arabinofuranosidase [Motilibacter rhizosphaerae]|uniref:non-reducing end alpha-L-arabinofuranosidase n=1 Tax=Motilibacter rhizosphaerae TaxID=598652 RepID=A0A4Q7NQK3_9ACTN|nr:alpha-N-arabinofuranosidase [Motilibacter rhizosphaerae]RZS86870.1 alpha-N-arabinofuranosidase [Motilibacter rhizosphaerae]
MITCRVTLDPDFTVGEVPRRLFGSFIEHMGRCVYGGIVDPGHLESDTAGYRADVLKLTRDLGVSLVRYPGGNFVSGYRWEDGVGPVEQRPSRLNLAWHSTEPNTFGLHEFMTWAAQAEVEPMMAVNLGTRGIEDACNLLEYANHPGGTAWSDLRARNGSPDPFGIRLWCLGNEMDGPWQLGFKSADEYGRLAAQTGKAMRAVDPTIELVACGSSTPSMPTFGQWEATVLEHAYDVVDYISLHAYFTNDPEDRAGWLASGVAMDEFIDGVVATADHIGAKRRSRKKLMVSFDEWNVWYDGRTPGTTEDWVPDPRLIEEDYDVEDAVVVGGLLMSLLRHADRVGVAALAQLVNVIAPIRAEPDVAAWRQTTFFPFSLTARLARGIVLQTRPQVAAIPTKALGEVPAADAVAVHDPATGAVTVFALNRHQDQTVDLQLGLRAFGALTVAEHLLLGGADLDASNTRATPERVAPRSAAGTAEAARATETGFSVPLPPVSWSVLRLVPAQGEA